MGDLSLAEMVRRWGLSGDAAGRVQESLVTLWTCRANTSGGSRTFRCMLRMVVNMVTRQMTPSPARSLILRELRGVSGFKASTPATWRPYLMICLVFVGASITAVEGMATQCLRNWPEHLSLGVVRARRVLSEGIGQSLQRAPTTSNDMDPSSSGDPSPVPASRADAADVVREVLAAREKGPWKILGVRVGDWHGIRPGYRQRLLRVHPDKNGDAEGSHDAFNLVRDAYSDLSGCI